MIVYNLKMALRNQARNKVFAAINVLGLSAGLAVSVLIINYVVFEFSFDKMHQKHGRIYRVESQFFEGGQLTDNWATSSFGYGSAISKEMPGIDDFVRIGVQNTEQVVLFQGKRSREGGIAYSNASFFSVFDFKLKEGVLADQLKRPNTVVITQNVANRFFKNEDPVGKIMTFAAGPNFYNCEVTGVLEDFPKNSHIRFNYLVSYETLPDWMKEFWYLHEAYTYLLLSPGKDPKEIEAQFPAMAEKYKTMEALKNKKWAVVLQPLEKIHLGQQKQYEKEIKGNQKSLVTLIIISIVILLTAWINYINLTTARAMEHAKDVGVRKVAGAFRGQLIRQYMIESWVVHMLAVLLAAFLVMALHPLFSQVTGEKIDLFLLQKPSFWLYSILVLTAGTVLSGFYPAFVLTRIKPSAILKGNYFNSGPAGTTRRVLVVFQFAASLFLICGTFIVYRQVRFMQQQDLGIQIEKTIVLKYPVTRANLNNQVSLFAERLKQTPGIQSVSVSGSVPGMEVNCSASNRLQGNGNEQHRLYEMLTLDDQFVETFGLKLLAGRSFRKGFGNDRENLLINESALATLGLQKPGDAIGRKILLEGETEPASIIGVVKNWHQRGLGNSYTPVMLIMNGRLGWVAPRFIAIKTAGANNGALLAQLRNTWQSYFPESSFDYFFLENFFDDQYKADKRFGRTVGIFTVLAFFISGLGLWALAALTASKKVKEVGVRKVLGAQSGSIIYLFSKEIIALILIALAISTPISLFVMKNWLLNYAFRTNISLWVYVIAGISTFGIAMLTVLWQSWKAATRNPVEALRYE